jgi:hypothetical protein
MVLVIVISIAILLGGVNFVTLLLVTSAIRGAVLIPLILARSKKHSPAATKLPPRLGGHRNKLLLLSSRFLLSFRSQALRSTASGATTRVQQRSSSNNDGSTLGT